MVGIALTQIAKGKEQVAAAVLLLRPPALFASANENDRRPFSSRGRTASPGSTWSAKPASTAACLRLDTGRRAATASGCFCARESVARKLLGFQNSMTSREKRSVARGSASTNYCKLLCALGSEVSHTKGSQVYREWRMRETGI